MEDIMDIIPILGDYYRAGKLAYRLGNWIGQNNATDRLLQGMAEAFERSIDAENGETTLEALKELHDIGEQYAGGKKYQDALFYSLLAGELYLTASYFWRACKEEGDASIYYTRKFYQLANTACLKVRAINKTIFTENRSTIDEARQLIAELEKSLVEDMNLYEEACKEVEAEFEKMLKQYYSKLS